MKLPFMPYDSGETARYKINFVNEVNYIHTFMYKFKYSFNLKHVNIF